MGKVDDEVIAFLERERDAAERMVGELRMALDAAEENATEMHRILLKRITAALEKARYYPATVDPEKTAEEILRPFQRKTLE